MCFAGGCKLESCHQQHSAWARTKWSGEGSCCWRASACPCDCIVNYIACTCTHWAISVIHALASFTPDHFYVCSNHSATTLSMLHYCSPASYHSQLGSLASWLLCQPHDSLCLQCWDRAMEQFAVGPMASFGNKGLVTSHQVHRLVFWMMRSRTCVAVLLRRRICSTHERDRLSSPCISTHADRNPFIALCS